MTEETAKPVKQDARTKLLGSALKLIRTKGYTATTVDDLCKDAGVTKGAFFHHFRSKDDLAVASAKHWSEVTGAFFAAASYHLPEDPLDRVLGYLEFRKEIVRGEVAEYTCHVGTMVQDVHLSAPEIRDACHDSIFGHAQTLEADMEAAALERGVTLPGGAKSLALHTQAVLQGAFVLAKASGDPGIVRDSVDHLIRYVRQIYLVPALEEETGHERDSK